MQKREIENPFKQKKATEKMEVEGKGEKISPWYVKHLEKSVLSNKRNENLHEIGVFFYLRWLKSLYVVSGRVLKARGKIWRMFAQNI
jgi:hypothetical protein